MIGALFGNRRKVSRLGAAASCAMGARKTYQWIGNVYLTIRQFLTGQVAGRLVSGPVGILRFTYESARQGLGTLFYWIGLISVNLAVLNLLPVPVLDGGHVLFALIEKVKGSPVSEKVQVAASYVGLALLLTLVLFATWNDFLGRNLP